LLNLLEPGKVTDRGLVRGHNEDALGYFVPQDPATLARKGCLYLVADGIGGAQAGEVASARAVEHIRTAYYAAESADVVEALRAAFLAAHKDILQEAERLAAPGMGTTAVALVIVGDRAILANVGDSPAYLVRRGQVQQLSEEHSWVALALAEGLITPEQAERFPHRHVITRNLGMEKPLEVYFAPPIVLEPGDSFLLCSDGLSNLVQPAEIATIAGNTATSPQETVQQLANLALERGAPDNITALLVRVAI
jgi:serine/threonine protein phosphatase PrpC